MMVHRQQLQMRPRHGPCLPVLASLRALLVDQLLTAPIARSVRAWVTHSGLQNVPRAMGGLTPEGARRSDDDGLAKVLGLLGGMSWVNRPGFDSGSLGWISHAASA